MSTWNILLSSSSQFSYKQKQNLAPPSKLPSTLTVLVFCACTIATYFPKENILAARTVFWSSLPYCKRIASCCGSVHFWIKLLIKHLKAEYDSSLCIISHSSSSHSAILPTKHTSYMPGYTATSVRAMAFSPSALLTQCYWRYLLMFYHWFWITQKQHSLSYCLWPSYPKKSSLEVIDFYWWNIKYSLKAQLWNKLIQRGVQRCRNKRIVKVNE